jgi:SH3 domain-containing YSC84-like protein 1
MGRLKKAALLFSTSIFLLVSYNSLAQSNEKEDVPDIVKRTQSAAEVFRAIMEAPDKGIPNEILDSTKCIAITPSMFNAGIGFGGRYGRGVASCRTAAGWSAPAPYTITGGSWGLQFGAQAVDLVMLVMNEKGMHHLLSSKFKIGADASAAAGPIGRHAAAGTDWKMRAQVLTYSRARGLFAGVTLNGVAVKPDKDSTRLLYGKLVSFDKILNGDVSVPKDTSVLTETLEKNAPTRRSEN